MAKNALKSVTCKLSVTPGIWAYLEQLTLTHMYGKNATDTAERILQQEVLRLVEEKLDSLLTRVSKLDLASGEEEKSD
jgi:hypothetical protein